MKCSECGKPIGNWPLWLENSRVGVRCDKCATGSATTVNAPNRSETLAPLSEIAARYPDLAEAA
ncbi:MAG TPA: hypothetical protein VGM37_07005 [Armatimonadota bacterium]|jgi:hypothetical protein